MYTLKKRNVVKQVDTKEAADRLLDRGFTLYPSPEEMTEKLNKKPSSQKKNSKSRNAEKQNAGKGADKVEKPRVDQQDDNGGNIQSES